MCCEKDCNFISSSEGDTSDLCALGVCDQMLTKIRKDLCVQEIFVVIPHATHFRII